MKLFFRWRREIGHGGAVPRGFALAWYEPRRRLGVYYPAPLHLPARAWREFISRLRTAWHTPRLECLEVFEMQRRERERQRLAEEYARGYMAGWRECFAACLEAVEEEIERADADSQTGRPLEGTPKPPQKN